MKKLEENEIEAISGSGGFIDRPYAAPYLVTMAMLALCGGVSLYMILTYASEHKDDAK